MAYSYPAAKHALLGLSAQYQAVLNNNKRDGSSDLASKYRTDALMHYNRGMQDLVRDSEHQIPPLEVLVACSLLFTAIELWPQKDMAPHVHISHAMKMCRSVSPTTIFSDTLTGYLLRILFLLAENVASFHDEFTEISLNITDAYIEGAWPIPASFRDPAEASEHVDKLLKRVVRLDVMSEGENPGRRQRLWGVHALLSRAIEESKHQSAANTPEHYDFRSLQLHLGILSFMLKTNMSSDEMVFDSYCDEFENILSEAEEFLAYELAPGSPRSPVTIRSSLGLITPLFLVATKCRNSKVRYRALELLHGSRRRERLWNSCVAYMLARTVVDVEEGISRTISDVPQGLPAAEDRVCLSHVEFDREQGRITVEYRHMPWNKLTGPKTVVKQWIPNIDDNYEVVLLSDKSLRAYGYTGTVLISPRISCQCG